MTATRSTVRRRGSPLNAVPGPRRLLHDQDGHGRHPHRRTTAGSVSLQRPSQVRAESRPAAYLHWMRVRLRGGCSPAWRATASSSNRCGSCCGNAAASQQRHPRRGAHSPPRTRFWPQRRHPQVQPLERVTTPTMGRRRSVQMNNASASDESRAGCLHDSSWRPTRLPSSVWRYRSRGPNRTRGV